MNAKIAAAISLGASSLALIGSISIANAANAATTTTLTQAQTISATPVSASVQAGEGFDRVSEPVAIDPQGDADDSGKTQAPGVASSATGTTGASNEAGKTQQGAEVANQENSNSVTDEQVNQDLQKIIDKFTNLRKNPIITTEFENKLKTATQNADAADNASQKASTEVDNAENDTKEKIQSAINAVNKAEAKVKEAQKEIKSVETDFDAAKKRFDALKSEIEAIKKRNREVFRAPKQWKQ